MEGVRKSSQLRAAFFWIFVPLVLLLICVSALWAVTADDDALIWIAGTRGIQAASQTDGTTRYGISLSHDARAIAVDMQRDTLWVFVNKSVSGFRSDGTPKFDTKIDPPNGQPALLALDAADGSAWLTVQGQVYRFDENGGLQNQRRMSHPITGITLNRANSQLWVAHRGTIEVFAADGRRLFGVDTGGAKTVQAMAYDQSLDQIWAIVEDELRRYAADGELIHNQGNAWFKAVEHIANDQHGGLWLADKRQLAHIDQSGLMTFSFEPFAGSAPDSIVSLVADSGDGSAWVASRRRVAHYAKDSSLIQSFTPSMQDGKTYLINQLALDTLSIAPRLNILEPVDNSVLATGRPEIVLAVDGPEADPATFEFSLNGAARSFDCAESAAGYSCVPTQSIPDGQYLLTVTVADAAGNRSRPVEARYTIDTVAPVVEVLNPEEGLLTNQMSVQISGRVNEPVHFEIDGSQRAVQEDGSFSHGPFTLEEGENIFRLKATDAAGNTGEQTLQVTRDTIPPPPPDAGQMQTQQQSDGTVRITGAPGSVEGESTVTVVNTRTGQRVTTVANPDGSFSISIAGENGDELQTYATDRAGNAGLATPLVVEGDPFSGPITLSVVSPTDGATVSGDKVLVVADVKGPLNTGVTVNGVPTAGVPEGDRLRFYATVPLTVGTNNLVVKAVTIDGKETTRTVLVGSTGPSAFNITAYPEVGIGPQTINLELTDQFGIGIQEVRYDFDSDGTEDFVTADPFEDVSTTFSGSGLRTITASIVDDSGTTRTQTTTVVLLDPDQLDVLIRAIWDGLNGALAAGEKEAAMRFLTETAREKYGPVFDTLLPRMADIISSYSVPQRSYISTETAGYGVNRTINEINRVFLIGFVTNEKGQWEVGSM